MQKSTKKLSLTKPSPKPKERKTKASTNAASGLGDYQIVLEWSEADHCYLATIPAWNNVRTHGASIEEASRNAHEVLAMLIEDARKSKLPVPEPQRRYSGKLQLRLPTSLHQRLAREAEREGVSLNHWLTAKLAG
jgi:predicted RNase H-like HicB family nuclease